jgi:hypothetical protein
MGGGPGGRDIVNSLRPAKGEWLVSAQSEFTFSPPPPCTYNLQWGGSGRGYLFFYMALGLNDFDAGKYISRAIGRDGP